MISEIDISCWEVREYFNPFFRQSCKVRVKMKGDLKCAGESSFILVEPHALQATPGLSKPKPSIAIGLESYKLNARCSIPHPTQRYPIPSNHPTYSTSVLHPSDMAF